LELYCITMSKSKSFWSRLSPTTKMTSLGCLGTLFVALLIGLAMCGGVGNYGEQLDNGSLLSSQAFTVEWQDGSKQEIKDFNAGETSRTLRSFTLIAKKPVILSGFIFGTSKLTDNISFFVVAIGLPQESISGDTDGELGTYTLTGNQTEHHVTLSNNVALLEGTRVTLTFNSNLPLEYLSVNFTEETNL